jgi:hypothetical protein
MAKSISSRVCACWPPPAACAALLALALAASGLALAQPAADLSTRILALESLGRARPTESAEQLERLRLETAEFSPQCLELLTVQGLMLAAGSQPDGAGRARRPRQRPRPFWCERARWPAAATCCAPTR